MKKSYISPDLLAHLEHRAGLLKERIYGTIILLAVLVSIDTCHTSSLHTLFIVGGTVLSVWAASLVASQMSRRIVMQRLAVRPDALEERFIEHAPLLAAGVFPVVLVGLSEAGAFSLSFAVNVAIGYGVVLMVFWSLLSARAIGAGRLLTLFVAGLELIIGLAVVGLKLIVEH